MGMMGKACVLYWCAGVFACTSTGEDARTPVFKHPILPVFHHPIIPFQVTSQFIPGAPGGAIVFITCPLYIAQSHKAIKESKNLIFMKELPEY